MEIFSLDSAIDPELHEVMDELLESVYGEEIWSQQSQLSVVALAGWGGGEAGSEVWNRV